MGANRDKRVVILTGSGDAFMDTIAPDGFDFFFENFVPEVYIDISDVFDRYIDAIHAYSLFRKEVVSFRYEQWYRGASEMRGAEVGYDRAVGLMPYKPYFAKRHTIQLLGSKSGS